MRRKVILAHSAHAAKHAFPVRLPWCSQYHHHFLPARPGGLLCQHNLAQLRLGQIFHCVALVHHHRQIVVRGGCRSY
jgi:hypothetical protein